MAEKLQYFAVLGLFSILIVSGISIGVSALPDDMPEVSQAPFKTKIIKHGNLMAFVKPLYTVYGDDPSAYVTSTSTYDGVAKLILTLDTKPRPVTVGCSGAVISDRHILTAAHCVTNDRTGKLILQSGSANFKGDSISVSLDVSQTVVHPDWDADILKGNDLAILKTSSSLSALGLPIYGLDSVKDDDLAVHDKVGYGRSGNGGDGDVIGFGTKRDGKNLYDDVADTMMDALGQQYVPGSVLQYDFDNGLAANDAFGFFFNTHDTGLGMPEISSAPGDSGGPTFNGNDITGITSYGIRLQYTNGQSSDIDGDINSTFGEFSGDTRVSAYHSFIDSVISGTTPPDPVDDEGPSCPPGKAKRNLC